MSSFQSHVNLILLRDGFKPNRRLTGGSVRFRPVAIIMTIARKGTEPPVNRQLSFEAAPYFLIFIHRLENQ